MHPGRRSRRKRTRLARGPQLPPVGPEGVHQGSWHPLNPKPMIVPFSVPSSFKISKIRSRIGVAPMPATGCPGSASGARQPLKFDRQKALPLAGRPIDSEFENDALTQQLSIRMYLPRHQPRFTAGSCAIWRKRGTLDTGDRAGEVDAGSRRFSAAAGGQLFLEIVRLHFQPADLLVVLIFFGGGLRAHLLAAVAEDIRQTVQRLLLPASRFGSSGLRTSARYPGRRLVPLLKTRQRVAQRPLLWVVFFGAPARLPGRDLVF
jgi:hypothetical protein